ncbi:MAG: hypothetical protein Q7R78_01775, partial [bacterium]|nr:hypothetical protein [bacterium]
GFTKGVVRTFIQSMVSALFIGVISYSMLNVFDSVFALDTVIGVFLQGFCSGMIGIAVGIIFLIAVGNEEIREVWSTFHKKIFKAKVTIAENEIR